MKTIFDTETRDGIIGRINLLNKSSSPEWGKMNVHQMLKHCSLCEEMYLCKRAFIWRLFGRLGLKNLLKDEKPLKRNSPTSPAFIITTIEGDVPTEKMKWIALIEEHASYSNDNFVHWFFGKMTKEQIGYFVYKHSDHHLRQFGV